MINTYNELVENDVKVEHYNPDFKNYLLLEWTLGNTCNFSCSYCPKELHDGSKPWVSFDQISSFFESVYQYYQVGLGKKIWIQITGGEPTLYPDFSRLIQDNKKRGFSQSIISNGSRSPLFWSEVSNNVEAVHLSFHSETMDEKLFLKTIESLHGSCSLHINFVMLPAKFDQIFNFALSVRERFSDLTMTFKPLRKNFGSSLYDYSSSQIEKMKMILPKKGKQGVFCRGPMKIKDQKGREQVQKANHLIMNERNSWKHWDCYIGMELLIVDSGGEIFRGMCRQGGRIGNVSDTTHVFPKAPIKCTQDRCKCVTDIMTTKERASGG